MIDEKRKCECCECNGAEMFWHKRTDRPNGGIWRCKAKKAKADKKYKKSESGSEVVKKQKKRWNNSLNGKISKSKADRRYYASPKGYIGERKRKLLKSKEDNLNTLEQTRKQLKEFEELVS